MEIPGHPYAAQRHFDRLMKRRNYLIRLAEKVTDEHKIDYLRAEISAINSVLSELLTLRTKFEQRKAVKPGRVINVEELSAGDIKRLFPPHEQEKVETLSAFFIQSEESQIRVAKIRADEGERIKIQRFRNENPDEDDELPNYLGGITLSKEELSEVLKMLNNFVQPPDK